MILHDLHCVNCDEVFIDFPFKNMASLPDRMIHALCGGQIEIISGRRMPSSLPVHSSETAIVFRDKDGNIRYPGRNDAPTPKGYERVEMRSLRELERFAKEHGARSEVLDYDRGTGRSFATGHPDDPIKHI